MNSCFSWVSRLIKINFELFSDHANLNVGYVFSLNRSTFRQVCILWHGGVVVRALDLRSRGRGFDSRQFHFYVITLDKLFTHMCTSVTKHCYPVMLWGWECRSGVTLAMHHRLSDIPTYWLNGLSQGDEYCTYTSLEYSTFLAYILCFLCKIFPILSSWRGWQSEHWCSVHCMFEDYKWYNVGNCASAKVRLRINTSWTPTFRSQHP